MTAKYERREHTDHLKLKPMRVQHAQFTVRRMMVWVMSLATFFAFMRLTFDFFYHFASQARISRCGYYSTSDPGSHEALNPEELGQADPSMLVPVASLPP
jgi:hypothetical protein